jgi:hypothetical protein
VEPGWESTRQIFQGEVRLDGEEASLCGSSREGEHLPDIGPIAENDHPDGSLAQTGFDGFPLSLTQERAMIHDQCVRPPGKLRRRQPGSPLWAYSKHPVNALEDLSIRDDQAKATRQTGGLSPVRHLHVQRTPGAVITAGAPVDEKQGRLSVSRLDW